MKLKVNITSKLNETLRMLSNDYSFEIAGYLCGQVKDGVICIDEILIPDQRIGVASVQVRPEDQVAMLKKYGKEKCKRVIGHWHSHHSMGCFWSGTDYVNMKNIMGYEKLFVFIVSSKGEHLIKVCMREPLSLEFDEIDLTVNTRHLDFIRKRIENIVNKNKENEDLTFDVNEIDNENFGDETNDDEE